LHQGFFIWDAFSCIKVCLIADEKRNTYDADSAFKTDLIGIIPFNFVIMILCDVELV